MLVFKNIRRRLTGDQKVWRYFRYAVGEIVFIVLGIVIVLQLQNYNTKRTQEKQFNAFLDLVYNEVWYSHQKYIKEEEGLYRVVVDLETNTYAFYPADR